MAVFRKRFIVLSIIIFLVVIFFVLAERSCRSHENIKGSDIRTIAVLMPSIQEMLCYIGGEDLIVAVSDHSVYPENIRRLPKVAGFKGIDYEALARISPDAVFSNSVHDNDRERLESLGMSYYSFDDKSVKDIKESMLRMERLLGIKDNEEKILTFSDVFNQKTPENGEDAIVVVGSSDGLKNIYVAGNNNIFSELLKIAGYKNGYKGNVEYPALGAEDLMRIDPENIFILDERNNIKKEEKVRMIKEWQKLDVKAVKRKNIFIINGDNVFIPGPRIIDLLEKIKKKKSEDI